VLAVLRTARNFTRMIAAEEADEAEAAIREARAQADIRPPEDER
jgi:hypothetical protein